MIFEQDTISFQILDVLFFNQNYIKKYNYKRNFDALSLRIKADTTIEYDNKTIHFADSTIGYFPSNVDYTRISNIDLMIVVHFKTFNYHSSEIEQFIPSDIEKLKTLFEEILRVWNEKNDAYKHKASSLLSLIFAEIYKENIKIYEKNPKIDLSIKYVEENYLKKDFSLQIASQKSFVSETYFRKLFRETFGISPKQYVIKRRIKHAASLIVAGYYSLSEIADICGYSDYKHFSSEFKKIIGVSPSEYSYTFDEK